MKWPWRETIGIPEILLTRYTLLWTPWFKVYLHVHH